MKMSLRFTAGALLVLTMQAVCLRSTTGKPIWFLTRQEWPRSPTLSGQSVGFVESSSGVWWISDNATGLGTLYNGAGAKQSLVVTIPQADPNNKNTPLGTPTGTIANSSPTDFLLAPGKPAAFLFSTIDGTIAAWNPTVAVAHGAAPPSTQAVTVVRTSDGSSYTGLTSAFINGPALPIRGKLYQRAGWMFMTTHFTL